ncbi:MAG TPA: hypothetical protein VF152_07970 [Acidimicrobiia bacterium]
MTTPGHHTVVSPARRIARGLARRCVRCGAPGAFEGYFRLRERCATCGYRPGAEEGFFLGVWVVNFAISEGLLFLTLFAYVVAMGATDGAVPVLPVLIVGLVFAVGAPVVFYPFSAGLWAGAVLVMHPERARP